MKPEQRLWKKVREEWPGHACRVESNQGEAEPGTPDCVLSVGHRGGWIELKVWPRSLEPSQLPWHIDAINRGAYAMVLCQVERGSYWVGSAEDYDRLIASRVRPEGTSLQAVLNVVVCALTRR